MGGWSTVPHESNPSQWHEAVWRDGTIRPQNRHKIWKRCTVLMTHRLQAMWKVMVIWETSSTSSDMSLRYKGGVIVHTRPEVVSKVMLLTSSVLKLSTNPVVPYKPKKISVDVRESFSMKTFEKIPHFWLYSPGPKHCIDESRIKRNRSHGEGCSREKWSSIMPDQRERKLKESEWELKQPKHDAANTHGAEIRVARVRWRRDLDYS